ncbi:hypothetical protein EBQ90_12685 [bacterium]|nr:hypothetical protein [bacterium]
MKLPEGWFSSLDERFMSRLSLRQNFLLRQLFARISFVGFQQITGVRQTFNELLKKVELSLRFLTKWSQDLV